MSSRSDTFLEEKSSFFLAHRPRDKKKTNSKTWSHINTSNYIVKNKFATAKKLTLLKLAFCFQKSHCSATQWPPRQAWNFRNSTAHLKTPQTSYKKCLFIVENVGCVQRSMFWQLGLPDIFWNPFLQNDRALKKNFESSVYVKAV